MKVGIIGATGTMGNSIAQVFASAECIDEVFLCGTTEERSKKGKEKIQKAFSKRVARGKMNPDDAEKILAKISTGILNQCGDCDLILESALEDIDIKKNVFQELDSICKADCIFATNTSSISITKISNGIDHPVIGMHFFNPATAMKLVEIIAGYNTPQEVIDKIDALAKAIGKQPVHVGEAAGFVVNNLLIPMINSAAFLKMEGVSDVKGIDDAMKLGANHPMGPLELGDLIGLDICLTIMRVMFDETKDAKYRPCPLLTKMVRAGSLGRKTGKGFYIYNEDGSKTPVDCAEAC
ncbi:MAG: 3-hydroxyacyl-CoA dehydrogenase NAD-binding domain-containing protein [Lachnospiraceae bacterium]|nr:3-hydroxyacyl-CoA dehydrogenase NAD-binding domain-containing protein [Lachnospiraceae bacterium]